MGHMGERGCQGETKEHRRGPRVGDERGPGGDRRVGGELRVAEGDRVSSERTNGGPNGGSKGGKKGGLTDSNRDSDKDSSTDSNTYSKEGFQYRFQ